jgi:hypothetical protein
LFRRLSTSSWSGARKRRFFLISSKINERGIHPLRASRKNYGGNMTTGFFGDTAPIRYEGPKSDNPLAFRHYEPDRKVFGKTIAEHLRPAVCYWHNFAWPGVDMFGAPTFDRPLRSSLFTIAMSSPKEKTSPSLAEISRRSPNISPPR